jgi:peptidyl-tRNA hydrolase, PTH1 family
MNKIIIGLGNPGVDYKNTRHNAGVMLVDKLYESRFMNYEYGFRRKKDIYVYESSEMVLVKTANIFMNESGKIIQELKYMDFGFDNIYVVHDDLDIKLGEYKIQMGKGPKEHNGVISIEQALGTKEFWRVRIGVENRAGGESGEQYVLERFTSEERTILDGVSEEICKKLIEK